MDNARVASIILCLLIVMMDVPAGILGLEAEIAQNKVKDLNFLCRKQSRQAHMMGLSAAMLLAVAHVIVNLLCGCTCIVKTASCMECRKACLMIIWVLGAVGFGTLVMGTIANESSHGPCGFSDHPGFLKFGGICCFAHGLCCAAYYVLATTVM